MVSSRWLLVFAVVVAVPCQAQLGAASGGGRVPVESFLRVAGAIGQERSQFLRGWPVSPSPDRDQTMLLLSAADRLVVQFGRQDDNTVRVVGVRLTSALADTLALKRAVGEVLPLLFTRFGAPTRCSDPLGGPSHLYAPQEVMRFWPRGAASHPSALHWRVLAGGGVEIELAAGSFAHEETTTMACDAKMP